MGLVSLVTLACMVALGASQAPTPSPGGTSSPPPMGTLGPSVSPSSTDYATLYSSLNFTNFAFNDTASGTFSIVNPNPAVTYQPNQV